MGFTPDLPILTERLSLRAFTRGDVDAVFAYRQRDDVARYLFDDPMSREACAEAVQTRTLQTGWAEDGDKIFLAIERRADHAMIGEVSLILRNIISRQAELGYILHPDAQGFGYATEAARGLLAAAFETGGLHRIYARCDVRNASSSHVMERLGMRREAHFREHALVKGTWYEEFIYGILEDEFVSSST